MNLTKQYPFTSMTIGDSFTVSSRYQHARVAASEFARKHGWVFTCRMNEEIPGQPRTMTIHRVEQDQATIDNRGRRGRRRIVASCDPSAMQFDQWLLTFTKGQSYTMPLSYSHLYLAMQAWCEVHRLKHGRNMTAMMHGGELIIKFA